jgi:hypothetical protein
MQTSPEDVALFNTLRNVVSICNIIMLNLNEITITFNKIIDANADYKTPLFVT